MLTFFKNIISWFIGLAKDNLFWDIICYSFIALFGLLGFFIYKRFGFHNPKEYILGVKKAKEISQFLLKENRPHRNGLPTHFADRFIEIWCSVNDRINYGSNDMYVFYGGHPRVNTRFIVRYLDDGAAPLCLRSAARRSAPALKVSLKVFIADFWRYFFIH